MIVSVTLKNRLEDTLAIILSHIFGLYHLQFGFYMTSNIRP